MTIIFGEPWDAPVCEDATLAETPVGMPCLGCSKPIQDGDRGLLIPFSPSVGHLSLKPWHRACFLRGIIAPSLLPPRT